MDRKAVKNEVLKYLESRRDEYTSGEKMAEELQVSRSAVWKAVSALREEGYDVEAVSRKGYRLAEDSDVLSEASIGSCLHYADPSLITVLKTVDSTNIRLRSMALEGAPHGSVVLAETQTGGRGRLGRSFVSPPNSGIYMSVLLRPGADMEAAIPVTTAAAVAVCEAVRELTGKEAGIKWVNDVYIGRRKICGILTEAAADVETGSLDYVVVGIGINFRENPDAFEGEVRERAGWVYGKEEKGVRRSELAATVIDRMLQYADHMPERGFIDAYRKYSIIIGKERRCFRGKESFDAVALDIDRDGGLIVETEEGRKTLNTGEISVRWREV